MRGSLRAEPRQEVLSGSPGIPDFFPERVRRKEKGGSLILRGLSDRSSIRSSQRFVVVPDQNGRVSPSPDRPPGRSQGPSQDSRARPQKRPASARQAA